MVAEPVADGHARAAPAATHPRAATWSTPWPPRAGSPAARAGGCSCRPRAPPARRPPSPAAACAARARSAWAPASSCTCAWRFPTQVPSRRRTAWTTRRSGRQPQPGPAVLGDGLAADEDRVGAPAVGLHDVGAAHARPRGAAAGARCGSSARCARSPPPPPRARAATTAAPPGAARRPSATRPASWRTRPSSPCGRSGTARPWKRFQVRTRIRPYASPPPCPAHLLTGAELDRPELERLLARAAELKVAPRSSRALEGRAVALVFERPSTRTRLSFEAGVVELGGHPMVLRSGEMQLSRGESVGDTARILSRHVAAVGVRTGPDAVLEELAAQRRSPSSTCSPRVTTRARRWRTC